MYTTLFLPSANKLFWLRWTGYTLLAVAVSLGLMVAFIGKAINGWPPLLFGAAFGCLFGGATGFAQMLLLKSYIRQPLRWTMATAFGWTIFWGLNIAGVFGRGHGVGEKILEGLWHGAVFGAILGLLQAAILPNRKAAAFWAMSSAFFWPLCAVIADGVKAVLNTNGPIEFVVALPLSALFSGIAMHRLLRQTAFRF